MRLTWNRKQPLAKTRMVLIPTTSDLTVCFLWFPAGHPVSVQQVDEQLSSPLVILEVVKLCVVISANFGLIQYQVNMGLYCRYLLCIISFKYH